MSRPVLFELRTTDATIELCETQNPHELLLLLDLEEAHLSPEEAEQIGWELVCWAKAAAKVAVKKID